MTNLLVRLLSDAKASLTLVTVHLALPYVANGRNIIARFADLTRTEYDAAHGRARKAAKTEPRATSARFTGGKLILEVGGAVKVTIPRDRCAGRLPLFIEYPNCDRAAFTTN